MPSLAGFSDNPLRTRNDLVTGTYALLTPLLKYQSPNGARIRLPISSAAHFDETAAQLEGFARPLWAVAALLASHDPEKPIDQRLKGWINGIAAGTDPSSDEYWGEAIDFNQRLVETEILAYALLAAPWAFVGPLDSTDEAVINRNRNIKRFLYSTNENAIHENNWLWFRVIANLALVKVFGVPHAELKESMDTDLDILDSFHAGGGWASDGAWGKGADRKQMDYYTGSFAIQFSQCVYVKYAADIDPERVAVFKQRARDFALDFRRYFDATGGAIPFGRSLTYRFAIGAFWAAVAMAEIDLPPPLTQGVVKGLLLRHLRYWASKPDIFYQDGTMNIGYLYPNMFMCENYNSPQSPYWSMKALVMMALPEDHSFWSCEEEPLPLGSHSTASKLQVTLLKHPKHILVDSENHHFLLSSGQYAGWPLKATQAKYGKFAYSTSFGFSVPTGPVLDQLAPDSTLAISTDGGESWRVRWRSEETTISSATYKVTSGHQGEKVSTLVNVWSPSKSSPLKITTTLIPPTDRWPDWHIRVHKLDWGTETAHAVSTVEGGFAIYGQKSDNGRPLHALNWKSHSSATDDSLSSEGVLQEGSSSLIVSKAGASGIRCILGPDVKAARGVVLKPDANTNLMSPRTLIPTIQQKLFEGEKQQRATVIATAVFAVNRSHLLADEIKIKWYDYPQMKLESSQETLQGDFVEVGLD